MPENKAVVYSLKLDNGSFIIELRKAKAEARQTKQELADFNDAMNKALRAEMGVGTAMSMEKARAILGGVSTSANGVAGSFATATSAANGFRSAQNALAQAMSGNFAGAAANATKAIQGLTASMLTNPILLVVAALAAVGVMAYDTAKQWQDYKRRMEEAREETERFRRELEELANGTALDKAAEKYQKALGGFGNPGGMMMDQQRAVENSKHAAEVAERDYVDATTRYKPDEKEIEAAKAKRDAALEDYKLQLDILAKFKSMHKDWSDNREKLIEEEKKLSAKNRDERNRQLEVAAGNDAQKMYEVAMRRRAQVMSEFGTEDQYMDRLNRGIASEDEIAAWRSVETLRQKAFDLAKREREENKRNAEEKKRTAADEARKQEELFRMRENAFVQEKDHKRLQAMADRITEKADEKYGKWTGDRIGTASKEELEVREKAARLSREAKQIQDEAEKKDKEKEKKEKPWIEGVVSARGMSIGDVFSNMRGMNGARVRDPNLDAAQATANNTKDMKDALNEIKGALAGEGVK